MIKKFENTFGEIVKRNQNYKTPGTPHHHIVKPTEETGWNASIFCRVFEA